MSVWPEDSDETTCDNCGCAIGPNEECEPDETGRCASCGKLTEDMTHAG